MEFFNDLATQIQQQASTSKSQLDEYAEKVREEMHQFKEENKRKTQELERQVDEYIKKMVEQYKPDEDKIVEFRRAKAELFTEMLVETDKELEGLARRMKDSMDPLKHSFEESVNKVSILMQKTQDIISKTIEKNVNAASATKDKFAKIISEHKKEIDVIKKEAENFAKSAQEMTLQIAQEAKEKANALAVKNQKKYEELMKRFEASFKSK